MKKTLEFKISIDPPRSVVWDTMLGDETYRQWTLPFCDGTYFEGSWEEGSKILFLAPNGDGMVAEIAESRPPEFVSIRHLGEIQGGKEDTTSDAVRAWAPAHENYSFAETNDGTELTITIETLPDFEPYMHDTYPKPLKLLKQLCESSR